MSTDFYSGIIFRALGLPPAMFTPVFAVARTVGWVAHWNEMIADPKPSSSARANSTPAPPSGTSFPYASAPRTSRSSAEPAADFAGIRTQMGPARRERRDSLTV